MKRHVLTALLLGAVLLGTSACSTLSKLPPITAESLDYVRSDPAGGTTIHADGVYFDAATRTVRAKNVTWDTTYPMFKLRVSAKGYIQEPSTNQPLPPPKEEVTQ